MRSPKPFTVYQPVPAKARSRSSPSTPIRSIRRGLERKTMEVAVDGLIGANIVSVSIVATAAVRSSANGSRAYRCRSYTVALLWQNVFSPLFFKDLLSAIWALLGRRPKDEIDDGVTYGGHSRLRRRPVDSFFFAPRLRGDDVAGRRRQSLS
ncbi:hypothetical protein ACVWZL_008791 [Bradyrhizobium sp. GM2.4]